MTHKELFKYINKNITIKFENGSVISGKLTIGNDGLLRLSNDYEQYAILSSALIEEIYN